MEKQAGYSKVVQLAFISLLYALGFGLVLFLLPFMAYQLSSSVFMVGVLVAVPALTSMAAAIPVGGFIDAYGRRGVSLVGLFFMLALAFYFPHASTLAKFILFVSMFGFASQMVYGSLKACLLDITPKGETSKYFSVVATAFQSGLALGPLAGGYFILKDLAGGVSAASRFFTLDLVVIILLLLFFKVGSVKAKVRIPHTLKEFLFNGIGDYLKLKRLGLVVLWLTILFTTYEGLVWTLEPLFNKYYQLNSFTTGLILSMFVLPFILFNIPAGILADRYGKMRVLIPSLTAAGLFMIVFGLVKSPLLLITSAFLSTAFLAFAWTSMAGLLVDAAAKFKKGGIVGVWNTSEEVGYLIGPVVGGLIAQYAGISVPFIALGVLMLLTLLPLVSLGGRYLYTQ